LRFGANTRYYVTDYNATITSSVPIKIGELTLTSNFHNLILSGEVVGGRDGNFGATRFQLGIRSNTLPSKSFAFTQERFSGGATLDIKAYQDTTSGRVVLAYVPSLEFQFAGWRIWITERATYNYFTNNTSYEALNTTGLTEITASTSGSMALVIPLSMNTQKITNLGTPTANADAATKLYVDNAVGAVTVPNYTEVTITSGNTSGTDGASNRMYTHGSSIAGVREVHLGTADELRLVAPSKFVVSGATITFSGVDVWNDDILVFR